MRKRPLIILFFILIFTLSLHLTLVAVAEESATSCFTTELGTPKGPAPSSPPGCGSIGAAGLTNPFPGGWQPSRLDMGYDGTFKNQIVAPFAGKITYAANSFSNWGGYLEIKADQPLTGLETSTLYFAEGISPLVSAGTHVNAGQPIAKAVPNVWNGILGNIEFGVAVDGSGVTDPISEAKLGSGHCPAATAQSRASVLKFSQWAQTNLHVAPPSSTKDAGCA